MRAFVFIAAVAGGAACGSGGAFVCESDAQCNQGGVLGVCQSGGYCSFPDGDCTSGQRYGQHVAVGLEGECVPTADTSAGSTGDTVAESGSASADDDGVLDGDVSSAGASSGSVAPGTSSGPTTVDDGSSEDGGDSTGSAEEPDPDLVLWLRFDDPQDPLADSSAYGREVACDTTAEGCPASVDGTIDLAALFDGTNDLIEVPHDPALETDSGLTVALSVRNDALSLLPIHTVIARPYGVATENAWELFFRDEDGDGANDVVFEIADPGGQIQLIAPVPVSKGEWMRIVAVWTIDTVELWFDGALQQTTATTGMLLDDSPIVIGGDYDDLVPTHWFVGAIDDVRVYRRVLTAAEITALP